MHALYWQTRVVRIFGYVASVRLLPSSTNFVKAARCELRTQNDNFRSVVVGDSLGVAKNHQPHVCSSPRLQIARVKERPAGEVSASVVHAYVSAAGCPERKLPFVSFRAFICSVSRQLCTVAVV